jgi:hypothetical protein
MSLTIQYDHFYLYEEMKDFILKAAQEYPDKLHVSSLTKSPEGRDVFLATITNFDTAEKPENRSGYYVQAGVHAQEGAGTTAILHLMHNLLSNTDSDLLDRVVFYLIPRVNPDGTEYALTKRALIRSRYEKIPGLPNALIPEDIDGDGRILTMRWVDPMGNMKSHPDAPEIMIPREPGDREGVFYSTCQEGFIENFDGSKPVFGMRSIDFNRSLPGQWMPKENASDFPASEIELQAVVKFVTSHPNIFAALDFHCGTNGILRPTIRPDDEIPREDIELIQSIGEIASEITGLPLIHQRDYKGPNEPPSITYGCSNEWFYNVLGISHYVIELGNGYNNMGMDSYEIFRNKEHLYGRLLKNIKEYHESNNSEIFQQWKPFKHPQLGDVEIGGFLEGVGYYMYPPTMGELIPKTTAFALRHARMLPILYFGQPEICKLSKDIYRVRISLMNIGELGTTVMRGSPGYLAQKNLYVSLKVEDGSILSRPAVYTLSELKPVASESFEWFISADPGTNIILKAEHPKCNTAILRVQLS